MWVQLGQLGQHMLHVSGLFLEIVYFHRDVSRRTGPYCTSHEADSLFGPPHCPHCPHPHSLVASYALIRQVTILILSSMNRAASAVSHCAPALGPGFPGPGPTSDTHDPGDLRRVHVRSPCLTDMKNEDPEYTYGEICNVMTTWRA